MRRIICFMHVSLDGFVCGPHGEQDWMTMNDDEMGRYLIGDLLPEVDTMLVGRVLFEGFAQFWPAAKENEALPEDLRDFARWMEDTPKVVFSKTLKTVGWKNARLVTTDMTEEVNRLKLQEGKNIIVFGGAKMVQSLNQAGLIDEYRLKIEPIVLGQGKALFQDLQERIKLKLIKSKAFDSGVVGSYYEKV